MATEESRVQEVFFVALEVESADAREAYLDEACGSDPHLRSRVQQLLDAQPRLGEFLQK